MTMSYLPRKTKKAGLGDVVGTVTSALQTVTGAIGTVASAANDPYLPETICHVRQLAELENGGRAAVVIF